MLVFSLYHLRLFLGLILSSCPSFFSSSSLPLASWSRRSLDRHRPCAGLILRRSAFSFACVGIVVVMSSYVIFILAAMSLYITHISISFRFVGRARSCLESLQNCRVQAPMEDSATLERRRTGLHPFGFHCPVSTCHQHGGTTASRQSLAIRFARRVVAAAAEEAESSASISV